ncbi:hypothetical protein G3I51_23935 [Streptomyces sp. SID9944]|nr:hypothetical protein [Streptomyces sp. SID9944]
MTTPVQPALDGSVPEPAKSWARQQAEDYETWLEVVWPVFIAVAATGRTFTTFEVADQHQLPDPPNPKAHWGRLMVRLRDEGYVRPANWACSNRPTTRHSGVRTWRGTAAARRAAA